MAPAMHSDEAVPVLPVDAQLGEGLHWDARRQCLWMVDIHGRRLIQWDLESPQWREWPMPQRIGWVIPEPGSDALIVGLQEGFARARLDGAAVALDWLARPFEGRPWMRLNDAKIDASGAIWAGSLNNDDESRSDGCLYRLAPDGRLTVHDDGYTVANGPAIRADGRLMLHTDSGRRTIFAFDLDVAAGRVANKRVWKVFADDEGYPDGMSFDAEGCVWVAHWGAGCVSRFDEGGRLLRRVRVPATNVTNVCCAGVDMNRLYVTTARGAGAEPLAGSLFRLPVP